LGLVGIMQLWPLREYSPLGDWGVKA